MSTGGETLIIPARVTAKDLATRIDRPLTDVQRALEDCGEADSADEMIGAGRAIEAAKSLGVEVSVEARDLALECLYEYEARGDRDPDVGGRAGAIVDGVLGNLDMLDELIQGVSENWSVARMPIIDRNVIRMGAFELWSDQRAPTAVVVSEAVRLAQTYSTERSASFVNGVLAALAKTLRG